MASKLEQLREQSPTSYLDKTDTEVLLQIYNSSAQNKEKGFQSIVDEYTKDEDTPSRVRQLYIEGESYQVPDPNDYTVGPSGKKLEVGPSRSKIAPTSYLEYGYQTGIQKLPQEPRKSAAKFFDTIYGGFGDLGEFIYETVSDKQVSAPVKTAIRKPWGEALGSTFGYDVIEPAYDEDGEYYQVRSPETMVGNIVPDIAAFINTYSRGKKVLEKTISQPKRGKGRPTLKKEAALARKSNALNIGKIYLAAETAAQVTLDPEHARFAYDLGQWAGDDTFLLSDIFNYLDLEDPSELSEAENRLGLLMENLALGGAIVGAFKVPAGIKAGHQYSKAFINSLKEIRNGGPAAIQAFKKTLSEGAKSNQALKTSADIIDKDMPYIIGEIPEWVKKYPKLLPYAKPIVESSAYQGTEKGIQYFFKSRAYFTPKMFAIIKGAENTNIAWERTAINISASIERNVKILAKEKGLSTTQADEIFEGYLSGKIKLKDVGNKDIKENILNIRREIDELSDMILQRKDLSPRLRKEIRAGMGKYLRRTYELFENPNWKPSDEQREAAILYVMQKLRRVRGFREKADGATDAMRREEATRRIGSLLKVGVKDKKDHTLFLNQMFGAKQLDKVFANRKNIHPVIRDLLGETKQTGNKVFNTIVTQAKMITDLQRYDDMVRAGEGRYLFREGSKEFTQASAKQKAFQIVGERFHALDGMYTTEEMGKLIVAGSKIKIPDLYRKLLMVKGFGQASATTLNHITHLRNTVGAGIMMATNGWNPFSRETAESFRILRNEFKKFENQDEAVRNLYTRYQQLGVVNQNARVGEFKALINERGWVSTPLGSPTETIRTGLKTGIWNSTKGVIKKGAGAAEKLYVAEDDLFRIAAYRKELEALTRANKRVPTSQRMTTTQLEEKAAEIVRNTMPTYDLVPLGAQQLRMLPFGNFYAFAAERWRNTYHSLARGIEEVRSGNSILMERGYQRLAGKLVFGLSGPKLISAGTKEMYGVSDEMEESIRNLMLPEWSEFSTLGYFRDNDGNLMYMDLAYQHPDSPVLDVTAAFLHTLLDPNTPEDEISRRLFNATYNAVEKFMQPFVDEALFTAGVFDTIVRTGKDKEGKPVKGWVEDGDSLTNVLVSFRHIMEAIVPGTIKQTITNKDALGKQILRSFKEDNPLDRYGESLDYNLDLMANATGLRFYKANDKAIRRSFEYKVKDFKRKKSSAQKTIRGSIQYNNTPEQVLNSILQANNNYFKSYVKMKLAVEAAENLGVGHNIIRDELKSIPLMRGSDRSALINAHNRFTPLLLTTNDFLDIKNTINFTNSSMSFNEFKMQYYKINQTLSYLPLLDLTFTDDITSEQEDALKLINFEASDIGIFKGTSRYRQYKDYEKRQKRFIGREISEDYPVTDAVKNPADRKLDNQSVSFNEVAANKENPYPTYADELERLGFANAGKVSKDLLMPDETGLKQFFTHLQSSAITEETLQNYKYDMKDRLGIDNPNFDRDTKNIEDTAHYLESRQGLADPSSFAVRGEWQLGESTKQYALDKMEKNNRLNPFQIEHLRTTPTNLLSDVESRLMFHAVINTRVLHDEQGQPRHGEGDKILERLYSGGNTLPENTIEAYNYLYVAAAPEKYKEITGDDITANLAEGLKFMKNLYK